MRYASAGGPPVVVAPGLTSGNDSPLGGEQRRVGSLEEVLNAFTRAQVRDPTVDPQRQVVGEPGGAADCFDNALSSRFGPVGANLRQEHGELVAAPTEAGVRQADLVGEGVGDRDQGRVARLVPETVVDRLEVIDIQHRQRQRSVVAPAARHLPYERLVERTTVGQTGERVRQGAPLGMLAQAHQLRGQ